MGGALGAANTGMLSTAVDFLASSVDLFHRTAGQWGRKPEALSQNALTRRGVFHYPLQLGLTAHSLPAISNPQTIFVAVVSGN